MDPSKIKELATKIYNRCMGGEIAVFFSKHGFNAARTNDERFLELSSSKGLKLMGIYDDKVEKEWLIEDMEDISK